LNKVIYKLMIYYNGLLCILALIGACVPVKSQYAQSGYKEDLSAYRPKYTASSQDSGNKNSTAPVQQAPAKDITKLLNARMDSLSARNKKMKSAQGFRVLVYTGNNSEEVKKVKLKLRSLLTDDAVYDEYKQPTFRIKAGDCYSRLDAYYVLNKLQKDFPNAIVVPDQINISKEK
jgi:hypothetical protein